VSPKAAYAMRQRALHVAEAVSARGCSSAGLAEDEADAIVLHYIISLFPVK